MKVEFKSKVERPEEAVILEGMWIPPELPDRGAAVICHPHPMFGGSMHNNVVYGLSDGLKESGFGVLCFNFRGVGGTRGSYDQGRGEVDDVVGALEYAAGKPGLSDDRVFLAGYSFGGLMALYAACRNTSLPGLALISPMPPMAGFSRDDRLKPFFDLDIPFIIIYGDRDDFCPESAVSELNRAARGRAKVVLVKGADHFYAGREDELTRPMVEFFSAVRNY
jgi:alpha/beta superfamily hydrolase